MINKLRNILKDIYFKIGPHVPFFNYSSYLKLINKRSKLPFTSIEELSKPISYLYEFTHEVHKGNEFYGHASVLKKYCNLPQDYVFKFNIEHGVSFTKNITTLDIEPPFDSIISSSKMRSNVMKKYKKHTYSIGPPIYYAKPILSNSEIVKIKKELGNNLLVFPTHSTDDVTSAFDIEGLCKKVKQIGKKYDKVRVCLYWRDVLNGTHKIYQKYGFECVTAGHVLDVNFLPRLKAIIKTASVTVSNLPGTHVGYCTLLNKPHFIINQKINFSGRKSEVSLLAKEYKDDGFYEILNVFETEKKKISKKQFNVVNRYWGFDKIKTKKELLEIIRETDKIYQNEKSK